MPRRSHERDGTSDSGRVGDCACVVVQSMSTYLTEAEAWATLEQRIRRTPEKFEACGGLCDAVAGLWRDETIDDAVLRLMQKRINCAREERMVETRLERLFLHHAYEWHDGVRAKWCDRFAREAAEEEGKP